MLAFKESLRFIFLAKTGFVASKILPYPTIAASKSFFKTFGLTIFLVASYTKLSNRSALSSIISFSTVANAAAFAERPYTVGGKSRRFFPSFSAFTSSS